MDTTAHQSRLLEEIVAIRRMERGSISKIRRYTGYEFFTHSSYENGKTVTAHVPKDRVAELQKLIDAGKQFQNLIKEYENLVVRQTRAEWKKGVRAKQGNPRPK